MTALVRLFSYGTLRDRAVQLSNFGRTLRGSADVLPAYSLSSLEIEDSDVVDTSGKGIHSIAVRSGSPGDEVAGVVFEVTLDELTAADRYEVDAYTRVLVTLKSGIQAWAYVLD